MVVEDEEEFTRLENLVPDEVNTEEKRISKFMGDLDWRIRQPLLGNPALVTFTEVVNMALFQCQKYRLRSQEGKKFQDSGSSSKSGGENASEANWYEKDYRGSQQRFVPQDRQRGFAGRCFFCKEIGHRKRDCPERGREPRFEEVLDVKPLKQVRGHFRPGDFEWEPIDEELQSD